MDGNSSTDLTLIHAQSPAFHMDRSIAFPAGLELAFGASDRTAGVWEEDSFICPRVGGWRDQGWITGRHPGSQGERKGLRQPRVKEQPIARDEGRKDREIAVCVWQLGVFHSWDC